MVLLAGGFWVFHHVERFLFNDPRFQLAAAAEYGVDPPGLFVEGVTNASRKAVLSTFQEDLGRSLYLVPLETRRNQLLKLEWIREASVARIWPNQILIRIEERKPVAFFGESAGAGGKARVWLIDADGALLHVPAHVSFHLPVVTGFHATDKTEDRKARVMRMSRLLRDVGNYGAKISEVNTEDLDNMKVIVQAPDGRALVLWLGDKNFLQRMQDFERTYPDILRMMPTATILDLRVDGGISAVGVRAEKGA